MIPEETKKAFAEALEEFADEYGYEFTDDYSGRFMFGATCCGVIGPRNMDAEFVDFLHETERKELVPIAKNPTWDNMGLRYIMYYKSINVAVEE